jgi:hypothetical protein
MGAGLVISGFCRGSVPVVLVVIPLAVVVSAPLPGLLHLGSIFVGLAAMVAVMLYVKIEFSPYISQPCFARRLVVRRAGWRRYAGH